MNTFTIKTILNYGNGDVQAFPVFGDGVSVDFNQESGQKFFRGKFNGKLKFVDADYDAIMAVAFDQKITVLIQLLDPEGAFVAGSAFTGHFFRADCDIDEGAKVIEVTPTTDDVYKPILDGLEKEFNLPRLAPEIIPLTVNKRPVLQIYNRNTNRISCILSQMTWEMECDVHDDPTPYGFVEISNQPDMRIYSVFGNDEWTGAPVPCSFLHYTGPGQNDSEERDGYYVSFYYEDTPHRYVYIRIKNTNNVVLWQSDAIERENLVWPGQYILHPINGGVGDWIMDGANVKLYGRIICDVDEILGQPTTPIGSDDMVENNLNYTRRIGYSMDRSVYHLQLNMSETPTDEGLSLDSNLYYIKPQFPSVLGVSNVLPICNSTWDNFSIWWIGTPADWLWDVYGRKSFILKDSYPLYSVISVLLNKINAGVTFEPDAAHSDFLYGSGNPIRSTDTTRLFITPKSNIVSAEYENAAQRGNITLKKVFEMLRDVYRCFWFVENGKLRIEHAAFFARGGNYSGPMVVGLDLTKLYYSRSGKTVADGQQLYKFDKPETYSRIEFRWMDDCTMPFNGAIDIVSAYVLQEKKEEISISQFTSDIDYILLNPGDISKDGFALLGAQLSGNNWVVPFVAFGANNELVLQNGYLAYKWLTRYYMYDLCARNYEIDGVAGTAQDIVPLKSQDVVFPSPATPGQTPNNWIPDTIKLVKTLIGNGQIRKMSINLTSLTIKATLNYAAT